jgi:hypothetical protein
MGLIFKDESSASADSKTARKRAIILASPFGLIGIFALVLFLHDGLAGGLDRHKGFTLLGAMAASIGFVMLIFGINAKKVAMSAASKAELDERPWLQRADWSTGRIVPSSQQAGMLLWIFVFFWCIVSGLISLAVVPQQLHQGNRAALIALIFPVIGLALFFFAWRTTSAWRRFGRSVFTMPTVPAPPGGTLEGQIEFPGKSQPKHGWHVALTCIRRSVSGPVNNLRITEKMLWRDEKWLRSDLPRKNANVTTIPVHFQLPTDKPESTPESGEGTHWKLEAWAQFPGPDYNMIFEVPVFKTAEAPKVSEDTTLSYQVSLDEIRKQIHSQIHVAALGNGKEFIFPHARNPGFAMGATAVCFIWTIIVALLLLKHAPPLLPSIFGVIDLLMLYFVADLWFRRSHVMISDGTIKIQTGWLGLKQQRSLKISDAASFMAESGAVVGHTAYYDLKLRAKDGKDWTLAKNLGHKPEADWLAREMTTAARAANANA